MNSLLHLWISKIVKDHDYQPDTLAIRAAVIIPLVPNKVADAQSLRLFCKLVA